MKTETMRHGRGIAAALALAIALALGSSAAARAEEPPSLDVLRKGGLVGERYDGMLVLRAPSTDATIRTEVDAVNAKRAAIYAENAKKQNVPALEVGKVYALQILSKSPPGTWFQGEDGVWKQKK